ncbi:uncharacterized protein LOC142907346 [Petromyzon marinus]|uniref:uncharacterized protein LOC142907346 n=1 Tax=Petromyzon marinus TaxID=7757 RepID=UPI003F700A10
MPGSRGASRQRGGTLWMQWTLSQAKAKSVTPQRSEPAQPSSSLVQAFEATTEFVEKETKEEVEEEMMEDEVETEEEEKSEEEKAKEDEIVMVTMEENTEGEDKDNTEMEDKETTKDEQMVVVEDMETTDYGKTMVVVVEEEKMVMEMLVRECEEETKEEEMVLVEEEETREEEMVLVEEEMTEVAQEEKEEVEEKMVVEDEEEGMEEDETEEEKMEEVQVEMHEKKRTRGGLARVARAINSLLRRVLLCGGGPLPSRGGGDANRDRYHHTTHPPRDARHTNTTRFSRETVPLGPRLGNEAEQQMPGLQRRMTAARRPHITHTRNYEISITGPTLGSFHAGFHPGSPHGMTLPWFPGHGRGS